MADSVDAATKNFDDAAQKLKEASEASSNAKKAENDAKAQLDTAVTAFGKLKEGDPSASNLLKVVKDKQAEWRKARDARKKDEKDLQKAMLDFLKATCKSGALSLVGNLITQSRIRLAVHFLA